MRPGTVQVCECMHPGFREARLSETELPKIFFVGSLVNTARFSRTPEAPSTAWLLSGNSGGLGLAALGDFHRNEQLAQQAGE
jgi:hypothetical protein